MYLTPPFSLSYTHKYIIYIYNPSPLLLFTQTNQGQGKFPGCCLCYLELYCAPLLVRFNFKKKGGPFVGLGGGGRGGKERETRERRERQRERLVKIKVLMVSK